MSLGNRTEEGYDYTLDQAPLEHTDHEKNLGVVIANKLKFSQHINQKVNKANSIMGVIRKSFRFLDPLIFQKFYKSLVKPDLEYAVVVWNPHLKKDIKKLDSHKEDPPNK